MRDLEGFARNGALVEKGLVSDVWEGWPLEECKEYYKGDGNWDKNHIISIDHIPVTMIMHSK